MDLINGLFPNFNLTDFFCVKKDDWNHLPWIFK